MNNSIYPSIDMEKTGILLKEKITAQGYTVRDIQNYLQLSCPQPVYRWFKGKVLPSLDHLLMLSRILKVHMEELLVVEGETQNRKAEQGNQAAAGNGICTDGEYPGGGSIAFEDMRKRLDAYRRLLGMEAA